MQDVVVTGDEVRIGLIGHGELLHGTRLDQLPREGGGRGLQNVLGSGLRLCLGQGPGAIPPIER